MRLFSFCYFILKGKTQRLNHTGMEPKILFWLFFKTNHLCLSLAVNRLSPDSLPAHHASFKSSLLTNIYNKFQWWPALSQPFNPYFLNNWAFVRRGWGSRMNCFVSTKVTLCLKDQQSGEKSLIIRSCCLLYKWWYWVWRSRLNKKSAKLHSGPNISPPSARCTMGFRWIIYLDFNSFWIKCNNKSLVVEMFILSIWV